MLGYGVTCKLFREVGHNRIPTHLHVLHPTAPYCASHFPNSCGTVAPRWRLASGDLATGTTEETVKRNGAAICGHGPLEGPARHLARIPRVRSLIDPGLASAPQRCGGCVCCALLWAHRAFRSPVHPAPRRAGHGGRLGFNPFRVVLR